MTPHMSETIRIDLDGSWNLKLFKEEAIHLQLILSFALEHPDCRSQKFIKAIYDSIDNYIEGFGDDQ